MNGTFIREPDGAGFLFYSPHRWNDPTTALRKRPLEFRHVGWRDDLPAQANELRRGEWLEIDEYGRGES